MKRGLSGVCLCVLLFMAFGFTGRAKARTLTVLGVRSGDRPEVRLLSREARTAFQYWSLAMLELHVGDAKAKRTLLVKRGTAHRRQKSGLFEAHRRDLQRQEQKAADQAQLEKFIVPARLMCTDTVILAGERAQLFSGDVGASHYGGNSVLCERTTVAFGRDCSCEL